MALSIGAIIGAERELRDKAAGLRTLMFICSGSALFTIISLHLGVSTGNDSTRIIAQIVSGIGFLGAGVILHDHGEIRGLTTAAMVWLVAGLGVGIGAGLYSFSLLAAAVVLISLLLFPALERQINLRSQVRSYCVTFPASLDKLRSLSEAFEPLGLRIQSERRSKRDGELVATWVVAGRPAAHEVMVARLMEDPEIRAVEV